MKLNIPDLSNLIGVIKTQLPEIQRLKANLSEKLKTERQCTGATCKGERCKAWAVFGDPDNRCIKHGGAETAAIPKSERYPACRCEAYTFPHRQRSGVCVHPEQPVRKHVTAQGQRRYYKRRRKTQIKRWMKEIGLR